MNLTVRFAARRLSRAFGGAGASAVARPRSIDEAAEWTLRSATEQVVSGLPMRCCPDRIVAAPR